MGTSDDFFSDYTNDDAAVLIERLSKAEKGEILEDMQDWETYMLYKEAQKNSRTMTINDLPPIRCCNSSTEENYIRFRVYDERSRIKDLAYRIGENFHPDYEKFSPDYSVLPDLSNIEIKSRENWDEEYRERNKEEEERKIMLTKFEKAKGNEAYAIRDYKKACEHYSNCIRYGVDLVDVYNNRAQANMKMNNFTSAVPDLNEVLHADPKNIKALFRRATCRKELKMYREALKDIDRLLSLNPESVSSKKLREEIRSIVPTLKGRTYRLRENFGNRETFQVVESQLLAYAQANRECVDYLMEIDKTGCLKSCVCNFCTEEDRSSFQTNNSLRIGNRPKWAPVTFKLLDEMKISCFTNPGNCNESFKNAANNVFGNNDPLSANQNELVTEVDKNKQSANIFLTTKKKQGMLRQSKGVTEHLLKVSDFSENRGTDMNSLDKKSSRILLKLTEPCSVEKIFGDTLNESTLTGMMNSVCTDFDHRKEWILMSEYLKEVARLKNFNHYFELVDKRTRNDISNILDSALRQNLIHADLLKTLYRS